MLHELYFTNLGGDPKPGRKVLDLIKQWFGSYEQWEDEFRKTVNALGGGSGWVIFAQKVHTSEFHNYWSWDHMHNVPMAPSLLVGDMYEHAYHLDYGAAATKYVDAFLQNVNWGRSKSSRRRSFDESVKSTPFPCGQFVDRINSTWRLGDGNEWEGM